MNKFYITTPIYYVNSKPHIGHSYTEVACDVVSRFTRMAGAEVFFITGTDEHGEKIEKAALERGFKEGEEKKFVDEIVPVFKDLWKRLDIRYDFFIRTTDDFHIKAVRALLDTIYNSGKIYKKNYKGWFCTPCETFWSESQAVGGICPDCKRPVEKLDEANYFLKISEYQKWLIDHINSNRSFIKPDFRRNEVLGFLKEPLLDLCISRPKSRMRWGIELPFDKDYVTYVWFDALVNYISGIGYPHDMKRFKELWPADVHVIGKDIIRHHAVYWPIILKTADIAPPKTVFAHGWWVIKGEKMSKSKGNVVDPIELVAKYGVDPYRYFLLREVTFGLDGTFSEEALVTRYNSDLANDLGNLLSRTLTMAEKYFEGKIPAIPETGDRRLEEKVSGLAAELKKYIPDFDFVNALSKIWEVINITNKYIEDSKPWALAKAGKTDELAAIIYSLLDALRAVSIAIYPFMPQSAENMWKQLGLKGEFGKSGLSPGASVSKSAPLFPRIET